MMGCGASKSSVQTTNIDEQKKPEVKPKISTSQDNDQATSGKNNDPSTSGSEPKNEHSRSETSDKKNKDEDDRNIEDSKDNNRSISNPEAKSGNDITSKSTNQNPGPSSNTETAVSTVSRPKQTTNLQTNPELSEEELKRLTAMMGSFGAGQLESGANIDPSFVELIKYIQEAQQQQEQQLMDIVTYDKMTPEQVDDLMKEFKGTVDWFVKRTFYSKNEKLIINEELHDKSMSMGKVVCAFVPLKHSDRAMLRPTWKRMVNICIDSGVIPVIIKLIAELWDIMYSNPFTLDVTTSQLVPNIMDALVVSLQNQAYFDKSFALKCCECDLLVHLKTWLTSLLLIFITKTTTATGEQVILSLLALSHQCAACYPESKPYFDACNYLEVINLYLTNAQDVAKTECLFCLAYIVDEENSELFSSNEDHAKYVVAFLKNTIEDINNTSYTVDMLVKGLSRLAVNDKNKKLLFDAGILDSLLHISTAEDKDDATIATNLIRRLSFHPDNKRSMKKNQTLIQHLKDTASEPKSELTEAAFGCLINLEEETKIDDVNIEMERQDDENSPEGEAPYIMISYNKIYRKQVTQIKEVLEAAGYKVWFDKEKMQNNTLETMVLAVWEAAVVLICASKSYEESDNCRVEVEQAFKKKKNIIPLMMESYQPSPWLDGIIGLKTFYDFSGKYDFTEKVKDLLRELETKVVRTPRSPVKPMPPIKQTEDRPTQVSRQPASPRDQDDISSWSESQVKQWVRQLKLKNDKPLSDLDGEQLVFLKSLHEQAPEFYFTYLKSDLQMKSLKDMTAFHVGLKKL